MKEKLLQCKTCLIIASTNSSIFEGKFWRVTIAPDQGYLGRCYVTLKKHKACLGDLTEAEWSEFAVITNKLEASLKTSFGATPFNWACMMNNAYQQKPFDAHVHWHFRPRYEDAVTIDAVIFDDKEFGHHYERDNRVFIEKPLLKTIEATIIKNFI